MVSAFKAFLESSTIHGLSHIPSKKLSVRLFWISVVVISFSMSGNLIYQAFQSWSESPIKTTIETVPIAKVRFPKVIVCPPKNTFTDLNDKLTLMENITNKYDDKLRQNLTGFVVELLNDSEFNETMKNLSQFHEEDRFYNWYHGITNVFLPNGLDYISKFYFRLQTYAPYGNISTKCFGEQYNIKDLKREYTFSLSIYQPDYIRNLDNYSLLIEIRRIPLNLDKSVGGEEIWRFDSKTLRQNYVNKTYTPTHSRKYSNYKSFLLRRSLTQREAKSISQNSMPGFWISWKYNKEITPDKDLGSIIDTHNYFIRKFINTIHESGVSIDLVWSKVKEIRTSHQDDPFYDCKNIQEDSHYLAPKLKKIIKEYTSELGRLLDVKVSNASVMKTVSRREMEESSKIFLYLFTCPSSSLMEWKSFLQSVLKKSKPKDLLLTFNRILKKDLDEQIKYPLTKLFDEMLKDSMLNEETEQFSFTSHHPVHIVDEEGTLSPTSFIPFCEFGGDMSAMGNTIEGFDEPVCNSFKARVLNDQLCYQVDPKALRNSSDISLNELSEGLTLLIDLNEDRMVMTKTKPSEEKNSTGLNNKISQIHKKGITIYLDTLEPSILEGEGNFLIESVKDIKATPSYYELGENVRRCSNRNAYFDCTSKSYKQEGLEKCGCLPKSVNIEIKHKSCTNKDIVCINNLDPDYSKCLPRCEGTIIPLIWKEDIAIDIETVYSDLFKQYRKYKGDDIIPFPEALKDKEWKSQLIYVRIYFNTPTMDRITKDRSAKFVDMLSVIGGTMGLLTGFSIISGVEIVYFFAKIVNSIVFQRKV